MRNTDTTDHSAASEGTLTVNVRTSTSNVDNEKE